MCETSPQISLFLLFLSHFLSPFFPLGLHTHTHTHNTLSHKPTLAENQLKLPTGRREMPGM